MSERSLRDKFLSRKTYQLVSAKLNNWSVIESYKEVIGTNPALLIHTRGYFLMRPMYGIFKLLKRFVKSQIEKHSLGLGSPIMSHTIDGVTLYCLLGGKK